jgi:hypothetical protein
MAKAIAIMVGSTAATRSVLRPVLVSFSSRLAFASAGNSGWATTASALILE